MSRILAELGLGVRLAFAGGRRGWLRTAMATIGVAIGALALLLGASVPVLLDARQARVDARSDSTGGQEVPVGRTVAIGAVDSQAGADPVRGRLLWPDSPDAPLPPGVPAFPADQEMYVSPALRAALAGPDGDALRRQMPYRVIGEIGPAGLAGPKEFAYYAGYRRAQELVGGTTWRVAGFGLVVIEDGPSTSTYVLVVALLATLLLPVAIFIGAALRFGADVRDRRLAAIRLIGADRRAILRIALGESLVPAACGLLLGTALYLVVRGFAARLQLFDVSVYPADVRPVPILAALVVAAVVALSAGTALLGFRGVTVEPLGVLRRSAVWRGRLWWRLIPLAASLALLYPAIRGGPGISEDRTGLGVVVLVVAMIPLLPYLVPLVARALPAGPASWQLASQQLRRNPTGSTRAVTGIVVAVAGAIALHSFFAAAAVRRATPDDAADPAFLLQAPGRQSADAMRRRTAQFERIAGVRAGTVTKYALAPDGAGSYYGYLIVGDCAALAQIAATGACADGDVFTTADVGRAVVLDGTDGTKVPVPATARRIRLIGSDAAYTGPTVLMTPRAAPATLAGIEPWFVETRMFTTVTPATVAPRLRGVAAEVDPLAMFTAFAPEADKFAPLRTALDLGSALILLMMGAGLLLDVADRLHERRRLLGVLSAVGARRSTVLWSVLLQAVVPVLTGLALAVATGTYLGVLLMRMSQVPVLIRASAVLGPVAAGGALVLVTTVVVLLPAIRRVTRTEELRYE
ncbi:ABC transporter permease [Actinoplanes sp. L3-i22]|uniref:ABC transporter permease n=1 Tax=Actinoplanes sp. L3-i22 TaxID=2836373 RepID=UPI001C74EB85|nr:FtsX-like permease family protein [Actinoplanes sp. L3-i22]BCY11481.1 membrane protein [Actinoplanes sp. L3-i22]